MADRLVVPRAERELGLAFAPVCRTVGADGVVREPLDGIAGEDEVRRARQDLVA